MKRGDEFTNYSRQAVGFLKELSLNNDRHWFKRYQQRYEDLVREPTLAFIRAMEPRLTRISRHIQASDKKVGGSMMRPQRDTRFSPDKRPYKTNVGVQFRHEAGKDVHAPGFYVHFDPEEVFIAAGLWHPDAAHLAQIREHICENEKQWKRVRDDKKFRQYFELAGDSLKRPPKGFDADHPLIEDLKRKDHIAVSNLKPSLLFHPSLLDEVEKRFKTSQKYMAFMTGALGLPF